MDKYPPTPRRKRVFEAAIRVTDLVVYAAVFFGGVYAVAYPPASAVDVLLHTPVLIVVWITLLLGGGLIGFTGRLTRYWLLEGPGTVASFFGILIYLVLVGNIALQSATTTVAATLVLVAMAFMLRRWLELQIFGTEPNATWRAKFLAAMARRTQDTVSHG